MADLRVSDVMRPALEMLAGLSEDAVDELRSVLEQNPDVLFSRQAAREHASKLRKIPPERAESLTENVVALLYFKGAHGTPTQEMLRDINATLQRTGKDKPAFTKEQLARLEKNLSRILDGSSLLPAAKALSVASDVPRLFTDARILSDLRPIFGEDVTALPVGAVISHSLRVTYAEEGNEKEFFVYLDSDDLKNVQEQIERALKRDSTLRSLLEKTKLKVYETS